MNSQPQPDEAPQGDLAFRGVNLRLRPSLLEPGWLSGATNSRLTDGAVRRRAGFNIKPWANLSSSGSAIPVALVAPLQGVGVFADPDDSKWIILVANGLTYYTAPNNACRAIALPAGVSLTGQTLQFVQANGALYMFRGTGAATLRLREVTSDWEVIAQLDNDPANVAQNPSDGTSTIPNADWAVCVQNRLVLPNVALGRDVLSVSDYFNVTRYQPTLESFRVSQPDDEAILSGFEVPTPQDTPSSALLVGKRGSIYVISGIAGDLSGLARQTVTQEYGLPLRRAIWRVGRDVWFVVPGRGVCSLAQTEQNKWQGVDVPLTRDVQPFIDRVNWNASSVIRGIKVGNFTYIAFPIDGATTNNSVLVYDHLNTAWAGYDTGVSVYEFLPYPIEGVDKLLVLTNSGYLGVYGEGDVDHTTGSAQAEITQTWRTRGYALRSHLGRHRARELTVQLQTRQPRYTLTATLDGANETVTIASAKTRDRTKYFKPHTRPKWVASNVNNDHATKFREDYSVDAVTAINPGSNGVDFSLLQETTERYRCSAAVRGQYIVFSGSNDRGAAELVAVNVESVEVDKRKGVRG